MNADELLRYYERVADAPGAVARLRRFILDLAVRGKLVAQDPNEAQSSVLLKLVSKEIAGEADIPAGWRNATLGALLEFQYGKGLAASDRVTEGPVPVFGSNGIVAYTQEPLTTTPSIVVGRKGSAGALNFCNGPSWTTDVAYFVEVPPYFSARFLFNALTSLNLGKLGKGVKPGLSRSDAYAQVLQVPPLVEQRRIVAKVDELMALCDRLEAARAEREAKRDRLSAASHARLNAPDPESLQDDTNYALDILPALTARPDQLRALRDTIYRMALRGCFSSGGRWPGKSSQLSEFVQLQSGYAFKSEWFGPKGVRLLRNVNVAHGKVNWADEAFLPKDLCDSYERFNLNAGDIVLSLNRPFIATGTKVAKIGPADLPALLVQRVARLNISDGLLHDYLLLWLQSSLFREQVQPVSTNVAPHIAPGDISRSKLFVPDIAEQHRIVAKVDELMALCNQLEASLSTSDDHRRRLLEALLHEALQPAEVLEEAA